MITTEALTEAVIRFNFDPVSYSHPSWWNCGRLPAKVFRQLTADPLAASTLSKRMLEQHYIDADFDFDFSHPFKRIAFLDYGEQRRLVFRLGLVIYHAHIAAAIHREEQEQLREIIGQADYLLALRLEPGAGLVAGEDLPALPLSDKYRCRYAIYLAGFTLLAKIVSGEPPGFKKRFYLIWPKKFVLARLAGLQDNTLSGIKMDNPDSVIAAGKDRVKQLLSIQGY